MEEIDNHDDRLPVFLRNLADSIDNKTILPQQMQKIGEFYMSYLFQEQAIKDNNEDSSGQLSEYTHEDIVKFVILGWYIYVCFLNK